MTLPAFLSRCLRPVRRPHPYRRRSSGDARSLPARNAAASSLALSLLLLSPLHAAPPSADSIAVRVQACTACHGEQGRATNHGYFPRIVGKPAGYLHAQLLNFRDGRRNNALMSGLVQHLSDDYLREIAEHFAAVDLPYPPPQTVGAPSALLARGEQLVRQGDPARDLPACAACHGAALVGVSPAIAGLLGLPRDYLNAQLGQWRTGQRRAAEPDCMARIAARLSAEDIGAVSAWLSSRRLPADTRPAEALPQALPEPCGSVGAQPQGVGPADGSDRRAGPDKIDGQAAPGKKVRP
ncbi:MAG: c-type cytochrome [Methylibium sp.]|nr:c-type cytochrome [Methylibium sp.]